MNLSTLSTSSTQRTLSKERPPTSPISTLSPTTLPSTPSTHPRDFFKELFHGCCLLATAVALILWGGEGSQAVRQGLFLCYDVIIPAMFPFFILSNMVISLGLSQSLGRLFAPIMKPLFHLQGQCATALVLGFVGGYPVGAKTTVSLYQSGQCTQEEAHKLLAFSNNAGPGFILGVIGTGMFESLTVGVLLYIAHILACVTVGLLFARFRPHAPHSSPSSHAVTRQPFVTAFLTAVTSSLHSTLQVCAFILCFTVIIRLLTLSHLLQTFAHLLSPLLLPFSVPDTFAYTLAVGLLELTSGVTSLTQGTLPQQLAILSFCLGWGGLSVHCQVLSFLGESGLSAKSYLIGNLMQGVFASCYAYFLANWFSISVAPLETMAMIEHSSHIFSKTGQYLSFFMTFIAIFLSFYFLLKKGGKIHKKGVY